MDLWSCFCIRTLFSVSFKKKENNFTLIIHSKRKSKQKIENVFMENIKFAVPILLIGIIFDFL